MASKKTRVAPSPNTGSSASAEARVAVLLEDVRSGLKGVAEGVTALGDRLDRFEARIEERFDRVESRLDRVEADVAVLKTDVAAIKTDVAVLKTDMGLVKVAVLENSKSIRQVSDKLDQKADASRVERIEATLAAGG
jgi:phage shock protein A